MICTTKENADRVVPPWRHYNALFADQQSLVDPCARHLHQAALTLALSLAEVPIDAAPVELILGGQPR